MARSANGLVELTDLIALGEIRIEVVFTVPFRGASDLAVERESRTDRQFQGSLVDNWKRAGHAGANNAGL